MSNHENAIRLVLGTCRGFEVYCPHSYQTVTRKRADRKHASRRVTVKTPLFSGYSFVRMIWSEDRAKVLAAPGVLAIVQLTEHEPSPLSDAEMDQVRTLEALNAQPAELTIGAKVRILDGAMAGFTGVLVRRDDKLHLSVTVPMFGRTVEIPMTVDEDSAEAAA